MESLLCLAGERDRILCDDLCLLPLRDGDLPSFLLCLFSTSLGGVPDLLSLYLWSRLWGGTGGRGRGDGGSWVSDLLLSFLGVVGVGDGRVGGGVDCNGGFFFFFTVWIVHRSTFKVAFRMSDFTSWPFLIFLKFPLAMVGIFIDMECNWAT